jgi:hypothetical protein
MKLAWRFTPHGCLGPPITAQLRLNSQLVSNLPMNVFIYFLLYIHHKSQASRDRVEPEVHAWRRHLWNVVPVGWSSASSVHEVGAGTQAQNGENTSAKHLLA